MLKQTNITNKNLVPIFDKDNLDFELKIGGTTYEVCSHFNIDGKQSVLEQFKNLILSENLFNTFDKLYRT